MSTTPSPFFPWEESYNLSYKIIDDQHQGIAKIIVEIFDSVEAHDSRQVIVKRLTDLINAARAHFMIEEQIIRTSKYPDYHGHRLFHDGLLEMMNQFRTKFAAGTEELNVQTVELMKLWMIEHTVTQDRKWRTFLEEHSPGAGDAPGHHPEVKTT